MTRDLIAALGRALGLLSAAERRRLWRTVSLSVPIGLIEALGLLSIYPLVLMTLETTSLAQGEGEGSQWVPGWVPVLGDPAQSPLLAAALVALIFTLSLIGRYMLRAAFETLVAAISARMSTHMFGTLLRQPLEFHIRSNSSELTLLARDRIYIFANGVVLSMMTGLSQVAVMLCLTGALALLVSPLALWAALSIGLVYFGLHFYVGRKLQRVGRALLEASNEQAVLTREALSGIREIKALGAEASLSASFDSLAETQESLRIRSYHLSSFPSYFVEFALFACLIGFIAFQAQAGAGGAASAILVVLFICLRLKQSGDRLFAAVARFRESRATLDLVAEALAQAPPSAPPADPACGPAGKSGGLEAITFHAVSFRHSGASGPSLSDLSLRIEVGESVALIGDTGAGKSTFADLVLGLLHPTDGRVEIAFAGQSCAPGALPRGAIGYVPQAPIFLDASVAHNITLGVRAGAVDRARLAAVIETVGLTQVIAGLPQGVESAIQEAGAALSGGERQRLALARALYHRPELLVLDETFAALDVGLRHQIFAALLRLEHVRTVLLITHDPDLAQMCRRVISLHEGRLLSDCPRRAAP